MQEFQKVNGTHGNLLEKYFSLNENIDLAVHIIDSRHDPMQLDIELNEFLAQTENPVFCNS